MTGGEDKKRSSPKCFEFDTNVDCEPTTNRIAIVAITFDVIVVIIVVIMIVKSRKQRDNMANPTKVEDLNNQYGTYYHQGVEYNTANDNNPRYNEDGGNDDAVVTDEYIFYLRHIQNVGNNDDTSANGNIYSQL